MNKRRIITLSLLLFAGIAIAAAAIGNSITIKKRAAAENTLRTGDIIFQSNARGQGLAIQLATKSKYTHVGMIVMKSGRPYVYEAVGPVKLTPLSEFASHGEGSHYTVKRLKTDSLLNDSVSSVLTKKADAYLGKPYDIWFGWTDEHIYCSEYVWKIYKQATGLEVGKLQLLKEFDLSSPVVQAVIVERYGDNIPYEETVVSPDAIFNSPLLKTVLEK